MSNFCAYISFSESRILPLSRFGGARKRENERTQEKRARQKKKEKKISIFFGSFFSFFFGFFSSLIVIHRSETCQTLGNDFLKTHTLKSKAVFCLSTGHATFVCGFDPCLSQDASAALFVPDCVLPKQNMSNIEVTSRASNLYPQRFVHERYISSEFREVSVDLSSLRRHVIGGLQP